MRTRLAGRARLFAAVALLVALVGVAGVLGIVNPDLLSFSASEATAPRPVAFAHELEGQPVGWLQSNAIYSSDPSAGNPASVSVSLNGGVGPAFYQWVTDSSLSTSTTRSGAIIGVSAQQQEVQRFRFTAASLTEVSFPPVIAGSDALALLNVTFAPQASAVLQTLNGAPVSTYGAIPLNQRRFRLTVTGLEQFMQTALSVEALTLRFQPSGVTFPQLLVGVSSTTDTKPFNSWHGEGGVPKNGTLTYVHNDGQTALLTLQFQGLRPAGPTTASGSTVQAAMTMTALTPQAGLVQSPATNQPTATATTVVAPPTATATATATATRTSTPSATATTAAAASCSWAGVWQTDYGTLSMTQTGTSVSGTYGNSTVTATASGNTLAGQWTGSGNGGGFQFTAAANCNSFTGTWGFGAASSGSGAWNGTRTSSTPPTATATAAAGCSWAGTWQTNYGTLTMTQTGTSVSGTYGSSSVTATASGNILSGQWTGPSVSGRFQFTMSANCDSFTGTWGYGTASSGSGAWNGTRTNNPL